MGCDEVHCRHTGNPHGHPGACQIKCALPQKSLAQKKISQHEKADHGVCPPPCTACIDMNLKRQRVELTADLSKHSRKRHKGPSAQGTETPTGAHASPFPFVPPASSALTPSASSSASPLVPTNLAYAAAVEGLADAAEHFQSKFDEQQRELDRLTTMMLEMKAAQDVERAQWEAKLDAMKTKLRDRDELLAVAEIGARFARLVKENSGSPHIKAVLKAVILDRDGGGLGVKLYDSRIATLTGMSNKYLQRLRTTETPDETLSRRQMYGATAKKASNTQLDIFDLWIEDALPTTSGRSYRLLGKTFEAAHREYVRFCEEENSTPLQITAWRDLLSEHHLWRISKPWYCPQCNNRDGVHIPLRQWRGHPAEGLRVHQERDKKQKASQRLSQKEVQTDSTRCDYQMDFSKFENVTTGDRMQDLIMCIMRHAGLVPDEDRANVGQAAAAAAGTRANQQVDPLRRTLKGKGFRRDTDKRLAGKNQGDAAGRAAAEAHVPEAEEAFVAPKNEVRHYVAAEKNNEDFVATALEPVLAEALRNGIKKLSFWSDGAGKHFKNQFITRWWSQKAVFYPELDITIHYFESNHGAGPCDSAAATATRAIAHDDLNQGSQPHKGNTVENAIRVINNIKGYTAEEVKVNKGVVDKTEHRPITGPRCFIPGRSFGDPEDKKTWRRPGIRDVYKMKFRSDGMVEMFFHSENAEADFVYDASAPEAPADVAAGDGDADMVDAAAAVVPEVVVPEVNPAPEPLPPNWLEAFSPDGRSYYYHRDHKVSQWRRPVVE
jgi:WW domain